MQRQVQAELGERDIGQQTRPGTTARDRVERGGRLAMLYDRLWFTGRIDGKERNKGQWKWQGRMAGLANRFIGLERRAWAAVRRAGKEAEARAKAGDETPLVSEETLREDAPVAPEAPATAAQAAE